MISIASYTILRQSDTFKIGNQHFNTEQIVI